MASNLLWIILFSVISMNLAQNWRDKVCTKESLQRFKIYKMDQLTHRVVAEEKFRKKINFVCCEGYRETSRNKEYPNCSPICEHSCGYGYCYRPNLCACYHGYEISDGYCQRRSRGIVTTTTTTMSPTTKQNDNESSTTFLYDIPKVNIGTVNQIQHKNFEIESSTKRISSRLGFGDLDLKTTQAENIEIATKKTNLKTSSQAVTEYPRVQFITHRSTKPTSGDQEKLEVESPNQQTNLKPSSRDVIIFSRVKLITHEDYAAEGNNSESVDLYQKGKEVESPKQQTSLKPSLIDVTDYPRVKFIAHVDSGEENTNPKKSPKLETRLKPFLMDVTELPSEQSALETSQYRKVSKISTLQQPFRHTEIIPKPFDFNKRAFCIMNICICDFGYQVFQQKYCHPCQMGSQCQCQQGYAFNSRSFQCKPLCNGSFDGCIRGTCIDYNECLCDNGTEKINDDNFRCYVKEAGQIIFPNIYHNIDRRWYLMLLTIPVVIVAVSFCVVIKRWRSSKANRLRAQKHNFPEIRYFNTNNNHRVDSKHEEASAGRRRNEPGLCESVIHHDGGVLVIKV